MHFTTFKNACETADLSVPGVISLIWYTISTVLISEVLLKLTTRISCSETCKFCLVVLTISFVMERLRWASVMGIHVKRGLSSFSKPTITVPLKWQNKMSKDLSEKQEKDMQRKSYQGNTKVRYLPSNPLVIISLF